MYQNTKLKSNTNVSLIICQFSSCPTQPFFCLNPGFNPYCQLLSYLLLFLGVVMPADQRNRFYLFSIKSLATIFIKCQIHAYFENLLHSLYTFFPGKQRCWRWRLLLNIKCQLFSTAAAGVQCSVSSAPLPPFLASSAQCSLVQRSGAQCSSALPSLHCTGLFTAGETIQFSVNRRQTLQYSAMYCNCSQLQESGADLETSVFLFEKGVFTYDVR